jgi:hypothetical protein
MDEKVWGRGVVWLVQLVPELPLLLPTAGLAEMLALVLSRLLRAVVELGALVDALLALAPPSRQKAPPATAAPLALPTHLATCSKAARDELGKEAGMPLLMRRGRARQGGTEGQIRPFDFSMGPGSEVQRHGPIPPRFSLSVSISDSGTFSHFRLQGEWRGKERQERRVYDADDH